LKTLRSDRAIRERGRGTFKAAPAFARCAGVRSRGFGFSSIAASATLNGFGAEILRKDIVPLGSWALWFISHLLVTGLRELGNFRWRSEFP
jgi:hypothetical protein